MVLELISPTKVYTDIVHPYPTVLLHSSMKGAQAGLVIGFCVGSVLAFYKILSNFKKEIHFSWKKVLKCMKKGMVCGVIVVTGLTYYRMMKSDLKQNQSRAFRLKLNKKQNIIDNCTIGSLVLGQLIWKNAEGQEMGGGCIGACLGFVVSGIATWILGV